MSNKHITSFHLNCFIPYWICRSVFGKICKRQFFPLDTFFVRKFEPKNVSDVPQII